MQILSAEKIRAWDEFTMQHEPVASIDLMERAATACLEWLNGKGYQNKSFSIFCGKGNNGGDGLALARMLHAKECAVAVYILEFGHKGTPDFQANLARLHETNVPIRFIQTEENIHPIPAGDVIIDALYGSGLNRPLAGVTAKLVEHINLSGNEIIAIDIPSGLSTDKSSKGNPVIKAQCTLAFECYKPAFLVAENAPFIGEAYILSIGLHKDYLQTIPAIFELVDNTLIQSVFKPRGKFAHKGNFGHALLVAGSYGKMGAAVLAAKACLHSGVGLLTAHVPECGYQIMQISIPEAMVTVDEDKYIPTHLDEGLPVYQAIGIGPGIGTGAKTKTLLRSVLDQYKKPVVLDADALNIISGDRDLLQQLPPYSILTPHPKEFERLFGSADNDFERIALAQQKAKEHQCVIVLKGHHTFIASPDGKGYFNSTGNAGMAKGGSGDALTGMVTALLAQDYLPAHAAIFGVYLHGLAGDYAATYFSQESMLGSDLIDCIGEAFLSIENG
jgi:hydroxyethylthiazole kinase-like uncharacterized protein yjeF